MHAGGLFRSAGAANPPVLATARSAIGNITDALNGTMIGNMTAALENMTASLNTTGNTTGPALRAFEGLLQNPRQEAGSGFSKLIQELSGIVGASRPVAALQGEQTGLFRSAILNSTVVNGTMDDIAANGTMNSTAASNGTTSTRTKQRSHRRHFLFF